MCVASRKARLSRALSQDKISVKDVLPHLAVMHSRFAIKQTAQRLLQTGEGRNNNRKVLRNGEISATSLAQQFAYTRIHTENDTICELLDECTAVRRAHNVNDLIEHLRTVLVVPAEQERSILCQHAIYRQHGLMTGVNDRHLRHSSSGHCTLASSRA